MYSLYSPYITIFPTSISSFKKEPRHKKGPTAVKLMSGSSSHEVQGWLVAYVESFKKAPENAQQLLGCC